MSYYAQGVGCIILGILLIIFVIGLVAIIVGIYMLIIAASKEQPGTHPGRCSSLGHDWRKDMGPMWSGTRCRNCLRIKGQPDYGVSVAAPLVVAPAYGAYGGPAVAYYGHAPSPTATQVAAYAPPVQQFVCPGCGSPVQAGMAACPWCNRRLM